MRSQSNNFFAGYRLHRRCEELALDGGPLHFGCFGLMSEETARELLGYAVSRFDGPGLVSGIYRDTADCEHLSRLLAIDIRLYFKGDILFNLSRNAKAAGLTVTAPLADPRMFELSATIPSALKLRDGQDKYIFPKDGGSQHSLSDSLSGEKGIPGARKRLVAERIRAGANESCAFRFVLQDVFRPESPRKMVVRLFGWKPILLEPALRCLSFSDLVRNLLL